jgi:UDP-N-acetylmuramoylalanine--D-glutamate ligase
MQAHIIGLGKSGVTAAKLLKKQGWNVVLSDRQTGANLEKQAAELVNQGITVKLGENFTPEPDLNLVVVSPGVPWDAPALETARDMGIETIGEMELAWRSLGKSPKNPVPWVAITGTNGKTTTTALIAAIYQAAGFVAPACGNIGYAACELALAEEKPDWVVAEISSYQIESSSTLAAKIGVWTTFTPDHLSRHRTLENYFEIKAKLLNNCELPVLNGDDPYLREKGIKLYPHGHWTSVTGKENLIGDPAKGAYIEDGWVFALGEKVLPADSLKMPGSHNQQNLLMAVLAAKLAGIDQGAIASAIEQFPGVPHRLELICTWQGIKFINDSKATNYDASEVGLNSVEAPAILIAGGDPKEGDDTAWLRSIAKQAVAVLLIGVAAPAFAARLDAINFTNYRIVETMDRAVNEAAKLGKELGAKVVLLSPACASFDQYANFEQRGDHFRQLCENLLKENS